MELFYRTCVKENIFNYLNNNILPNNYTLCEEKTLEIDKSFSLKVF
ncbi:hypothetical protein [Pigmentibacter ruber]|nr:hypothetical protein [Pigmentibacter ruber]